MTMRKTTHARAKAWKAPPLKIFDPWGCRCHTPCERDFLMEAAPRIITRIPCIRGQAMPDIAHDVCESGALAGYRAGGAEGHGASHLS